MALQPVTIHMEKDKVKVDPPVVDLSKENRDTINWVTEPKGQPFLVCFDGRSPFRRNHFDQANSNSGGIEDPSETVYKYTVEFQGQVLDPGVVIRP